MLYITGVCVFYLNLKRSEFILTGRWTYHQKPFLLGPFCDFLHITCTKLKRTETIKSGKAGFDLKRYDIIYRNEMGPCFFDLFSNTNCNTSNKPHLYFINFYLRCNLSFAHAQLCLVCTITHALKCLMVTVDG